ncbi:MAG: hypothetical protein Q7U04_01145 [Bacteriovorax sp.]|nr:hypothetical protein [Bacteriovorax sp.]
MKKYLLCFFCFISFEIFALENIITEEGLQNPVILNQGQSYFLNLSKSYYIDHLVISAEGIADDSMLEVLVDDEVRGTIYAPGIDPQYVVTIKEVNHRIEFRHRSGAKMRILGVKIFHSENGFDPNTRGLPVSKYYAANFANQVILLTKTLETILPFEDFKKNLLPTKIAAGQLFAIADARGDISVKTLEKFQALYFTMNMANGYVDELLSSNSTFDLAVKFLEMKEEIKDQLDI